MPSIIEGYNYDIFISYRQKDNISGRQGAQSWATQSSETGWVSEFVEALKAELESTFKEEISVYFDIHPHDGLPDTHDVDESLKDKLKSLIFIPIISRTYCDPKSFAWEHELKAFVELASKDQFGLKAKLPNGNVASRVLPVRIHELNSEDIKLCETLLGTVLRGIEFIYASPGVNRPLRLNEVNPHNNLKRTIYRDQINKVANAISEIISGLQGIRIIPAAEGIKDKVQKLTDSDQEYTESCMGEHSGARTSMEQPGIKKIHIKKKTWIYSLLSSVIVILVVVAILLFSSGSTLPFSERDWIIITDFDNLTDDPVFDKSLYSAFSLTMSQSKYINVFPKSRMLETLAMMEIKGQTSVDEKTGREMAIREGFNLFIVPGISRVGDKFAISAKIIEVSSGNLLKSLILYAEKQDEILEKLDQLSKKIRRDLGESRFDISVQDKPLSQVTTSSLEALKLYSIGIDKQVMTDFNSAKDYFERALLVDTGFTAARASLGNLNIEKFDPVRGKELLSQAVKNIDNLTERERLGILAFYEARVENDLPKAIEYVNTRINLYPDDPAAHNNLAWYYWNSGNLEKAAQAYKECIRCDRHLVLPYGSLLWIYLEYLGEADSALIWAQKMVQDNPMSPWSYANLGSAWLCLDSLDKAEEAYTKAGEINPDLIENLYNLAHTYRLLKKYEKAISALNHIYELNKNDILVNYTLGINYQYVGNRRETNRYLTAFRKTLMQQLGTKSPDSVEIYSDLAAVSARLGEMNYSMQMLLKAIEIDSTQHVNFAEVLCLHGKFPEALNELEKAFRNGYRNLYWLKASPDLESLQYDIRFRDLLNKYFKN